MRVITGSVKGVRLKSLPGTETRPTADMVKQGIFNIVQFSVEERRVLDLFAGTGQLAIEALSRGASEAVLVDNSPEAVKIIGENLRHTRTDGRARVVRSDYKAYLQSAPKRYFDLIFLDPPYREGYLERILSFVDSFDIAAENGIIICEGSAKEKLPEKIGALRAGRSYRYGGTAVTVYVRESDRL